MYRSGKAAQRLLPLTPLLQTGDIIRMTMVDYDFHNSDIISEKFSSWLTHKSLAPELLRCVAGGRRFSAAPPPPPLTEVKKEV